MELTLFDDKPNDVIIDFPTAYDKIMERVSDIKPAQYPKTRNFINGAVTYLSPYISRGVISVKQVKEEALQKGFKPYQLQKFLQELAWREYYQRVWQAVGEGIWKDLKQPQPDVLHQKMITAVDDAATGIEAIDQAINNLYSTGYMHNHVRMYTAALVCNMGKAYWLQPSRWLYYHLLDGDIASNNCSWQWVAAAFAGKKYYCNQDNVNKYTFSTQQHTFLDQPYPEIVAMPVPEALQPTSGLSLKTTLPSTKMPVLDAARPTLIYNAYNLDPLWRKGEDVNRVLLLEPSVFEKYPVSEKVLQFIIDLSKNIEGLQIFTGETDEISSNIISKEHPLFAHYPGTKDSRDWMYPEVTGYYNSFFSFWKKCEKYLK